MRGIVRFTAGGVERELRFTTNALCDLEEATGRRVQDFVDEVSDPTRATIKSLRTLVAYGAGCDATQAGAIIDEVGFNAAGELIGRALSLAFNNIDPADTPPDAAAGKPVAAVK